MGEGELGECVDWLSGLALGILPESSYHDLHTSEAKAAHMLCEETGVESTCTAGDEIFWIKINNPLF